jgi:hypothetical protein
MSSIASQAKPPLSQQSSAKTANQSLVQSKPVVPVVAATPATPAASQTITVDNIQYRFPLDKTLKSATKLSIQNDKPIMLDYWTASLDKKINVGITPDKDRYLVKSQDEYTSKIVKLYSIDNVDLIAETENSIYIVSNSIGTKKIE